MDFEVVRNDISTMGTDAIVLPANPLLKEGSGTSKAIYERAGRRSLNKACKEIIVRHKSIRVGTAVPTLGFKLNAKFIIHSVVPRWKGGNNGEYEKLSSAYLSTLELADLMDCETIAVPLLASGNNGFDLDTAIRIAMDSIKAYAPSNKLNKVYLVTYGMRATNKVKQLGIEVTEFIDQAYVLGKDERFKPLGGRIIDEGADIAHKWGDYALDRAMEFLNNPKNLDLVIEAGKKIALEQGIDELAGKAMGNAIKQFLPKDQDDKK